MYEICAFLRNTTPKARKPVVNRRKAIKVGCHVELYGKAAVVVERDTRFANAWFVEVDGVRVQYSFGRDFLKVL